MQAGTGQGRPTVLTRPCSPSLTVDSRVTVPAAAPGRLLILAGVLTCALIWGTTWYAITFQLEAAEPMVSVVLRFSLASAVLFAVSAVIRAPLRLTVAQHLAALGQGACAFGFSYALVYASETRVASAVPAVIFASLTFLNLVLFRVLSGQKAAVGAWAAAGLGLAGVALLSFGQIADGGLGGQAAAGIALAVAAVTASALGNWFAWRGQEAGAAVLPATAWAMAYGSALLALFALARGVSWAVDWSPGYVASLLYLSLFGSVIAFGLYFTIARVSGYALASYVSALSPPVAMGVSVAFEGARFGLSAFIGLALVLAGQVLLIRSR